ncbi:hypothetical protein BBP40_005695, partial [Aspergillus hancockii]
GSSVGAGSKGSDKLSGSGDGVNGKSEGAADERREDSKEGDSDEEANPVEWIMVTRSDPGGNIPRWMVEKGTPKSICTDAIKFLDWACRDPNSPARQEADDVGPESKVKRRRGSQHTAGVQGTEGSDLSDSDFSDTEVEHHGLIASFAYLLNAGLERYAPQAVLDYLPRHAHHPSGDMSDFSSDDEDKSPMPSEDPPLAKNPMEGAEKDDDIISRVSQDKASSINSGLATPIEAGHNNIPPSELMQIEKRDGKLTSHEKQLAKLAQRKRNVEAQLERVRTDIRSYNLPTLEDGNKRDKSSTVALAAADNSSDQVSTSAGSSNQRPSPESRPSKQGSNRETAKMHKVASGLFNEESKLLKQLGKIERHQLKEASKIEAQQRKQADREVKTRSRTEVDILRHENRHLKKELERLRGERRQWLDLISTLQTENANLAVAAGKTEK